MFVAKPFLGSEPKLNSFIREFENKEDAVAYLEEMTGYTFAYPVTPNMLPKSKKKLLEQFDMTPEERQRRIDENETTYPDWELLGKLYRK